MGWWFCPKQWLGRVVVLSKAVAGWGGGVVQSSGWVGWWFCPKQWLGRVVVLSKAVAG